MNARGDTVLCLTCAPTNLSRIPSALRHSGNGEVRLFYWQKLLARAMGRARWLSYALSSAVVLLCLSVALAFYPITRRYACAPLLLAVLVSTLREAVPLAPVPFNVYNTVTSTFSQYATAALTSLAALGILAFYGMFVSFSERLGNVVFFLESGMASQPPSYMDKEHTWLSLALVVVPLVYTSSLLVSSRFINA